jgi:glyoxylase-like metal-dependent hydrolase (beta-lactamase superfamily II)
MTTYFRDLSVLRQGDSQGNGMIIRIVQPDGEVIHAVAVPREGYSYTGPTWAYLLENEGLTLIDSGVMDSYRYLAEGIQFLGYQPRDVERVIITHGHEDHDGAVGQLVDEAGAELWAHDIYHHLIQYAPRDIQGRAVTPMQREMERVVDSNELRMGPNASRERYLERRKGLEVKHRIKAGEQSGKLTFLYAPGHSPDELCIALNGAVFTGDHVLPEITPHPTNKTRYAPEVKQALPAEYHEEDSYYGLETYLRSLQMIADLGPSVAVLPAHRLFNRDKFNFETTERAQATIDHHGERLGHILQRLGSDTVPLEDLTRSVFEYRKLEGGNLYAALAEIVAHVEMLEDTEDLVVTDDAQLQAKGSDNYRQLMRELSQ